MICQMRAVLRCGSRQLNAEEVSPSATDVADPLTHIDLVEMQARASLHAPVRLAANTNQRVTTNESPCADELTRVSVRAVTLHLSKF